MRNTFFGRDVVSVKDFTRSDLEDLFKFADAIETYPYERRTQLARGRLLGLLFYEPSTRTRLSFESAMLSIGGHAVGFSDPHETSVEKGENLADTVRVVEGYCDLLALRHPMEGAARFAAEVASKPLINAGSGAEEHPTQAVLDLYTIMREKKRIDGLSIAIVGDLKYGRTVYSLLYGLSRFTPKVFLVSPPQLRIRREALFELEQRLTITEHESLEEVVQDIDVLYVTRIQRERFPDPHEYQKVKGSYVIEQRLLEKGKEGLIVMHPLPRVQEITPDIDATPQAKYFEQARVGKIVRAALISMILNEEPAVMG